MWWTILIIMIAYLPMFYRIHKRLDYLELSGTNGVKRWRGLSMYENKFVETSLGGFFSASTYRETIKSYAADGWKLVQVMPLEYNGYGKPKSYEIIFDRPVQPGRKSEE